MGADNALELLLTIFAGMSPGSVALFVFTLSR
jgi:hypothetical protein